MAHQHRSKAPAHPSRGLLCACNDAPAEVHRRRPVEHRVEGLVAIRTHDLALHPAVDPELEV